MGGEIKGNEDRESVRSESTKNFEWNSTTTDGEKSARKRWEKNTGQISAFFPPRITWKTICSMNSQWRRTNRKRKISIEAPLSNPWFLRRETLIYGLSRSRSTDVLRKEAGRRSARSLCQPPGRSTPSKGYTRSDNPEWQFTLVDCSSSGRSARACFLFPFKEKGNLWLCVTRLHGPRGGYLGRRGLTEGASHARLRHEPRPSDLLTISIVRAVHSPLRRLLPPST